jgi:hypothetical protein
VNSIAINPHFSPARLHSAAPCGIKGLDSSKHHPTLEAAECEHSVVRTI